ncbi:hypothetical protein A5662_25105 [Mycobacteriaceae bacterium 1482268.1]|nr:hypothetical protein A5662_25105 [Mycobacteriaceae bacterium 1482268.1]
MGIRALSCAGGDDADLIQRQPAFPHALCTARKFFQPVGDGDDRVRVGQRGAQLPGHQRRRRARASGTTQLVAIHLRDDLHNA